MLNEILSSNSPILVFLNIRKAEAGFIFWHLEKNYSPAGYLPAQNKNTFGYNLMT